MESQGLMASWVEAAQLESKERYERMANTLPVMLYDSYLGPDGTSRFLYVAPGPCRELLELDPEALLKDMSLVWDIVHPEDLDRFYREDVAANRARREFTSEVRIITPSGRLKWLLVNSKPNPAPPGEPVVWSGYLQDITARKQAEKERERFFKFFQTSSELMCIADPDGSIVQANPVFIETLGYAETELYSKPVTAFIHPEDRQATLDEIARQKRVGFTKDFENRYLCRDGSVRWLSWRVSSSPDEGVVYGAARDITESKQAEETLRAREEQLRVIFDASQAGIILVGPEGTILFANNSMAEMFGTPLEKLIGSPYPAHLHPDEKGTGEELMFRLIRGEVQSVSIERHYLRADGSDFWGLLSGKRLENPDGSLRALIGVIADFTERIQLQRQLAQAQKIESVGRLAGGVAHDFNNMLNVILGHAEMARRKEAGPPLGEHLAQIQAAAERSAEIVRQLLAFARKQTVTPKVLDLNETVQGTLKMLGRLIGEEIDLVWWPERDLWPVKLDPAQIDQILTNLCINARDAMAGAGRITIETRNNPCDEAFCAGRTGLGPGDYVLLAVGDDGCGMEQEVQKKIFDPFFTTKEVGEGTGLGLATVYGIVKQNDGFIDVSSQPGRGTNFNIYLPRHRGGEMPAANKDSLAPGERGGETVLLVEDEPAILDVGRQLLEMQGYRVLTAGTPGEAIRLAEENGKEIHLLLADVVMPEMNGRELAGTLLSRYPGLKCLFMSGYTADVIAHHGVIDEGLQFLQKPFTFDSLAAKVREVLDR